ncbi:unnamed protein product [Chrysoparadoxa australica]
MYYKHWSEAGKPGDSFFPWLEESAEELAECPRDVLEADTVTYLITDEQRKEYEVLLKPTNTGPQLVHCASSKPINTGGDGWIFVMRGGRLYASTKRTTAPRFHHSSFFGGEYVESAGLLVANKGIIECVYPHSGHYRPTDNHLAQLLVWLHLGGVDLTRISVDAQRTYKVARQEKVKKIDSPFMANAKEMLDFLEHKAKAWESGLFAELCDQAAAYAGGDTNLLPSPSTSPKESPSSRPRLETIPSQVTYDDSDIECGVDEG